MWVLTTSLFLLASTIAIRAQEVDDENCVCVPYYQCYRDNNTIITDGLNIIDIRAKTCEHYLQTCCVPPKDDANQNTSEGTDNSNLAENALTKEHESRGCGFRNPNGIGFRIKGNDNGEAQFAEFPWMVALLTKSDVKGVIRSVYACGASLIHPQIVLTAAHCVQGKVPGDLRARAGEWDTQTTTEHLPFQDRLIKDVRIHPKYRPGIVHNDFALLVLDAPVELADNVETICLPSIDDKFDGSRCIATGWGKNEFGKEGNYQAILKSIELPIVPKNRCQLALRKTRLGNFFILDKSFMCAGGERGLDTCTGDGGSPLVCPIEGIKDRYIQAGIVSWGIGCGEDGIPGVYADVAYARDWIDSEVSTMGIDTSSLTEDNLRISEKGQPAQSDQGGRGIVGRFGEKDDSIDSVVFYPDN